MHFVNFICELGFAIQEEILLFPGLVLRVSLLYHALSMFAMSGSDCICKYQLDTYTTRARLI